MSSRGTFVSRSISVSVCILILFSLFTSNSLLASNLNSQECMTENIPQEVQSYLLKDECVVNVERRVYAPNSETQKASLTKYVLSSGKILVYSDFNNKSRCWNIIIDHRASVRSS